MAEELRVDVVIVGGGPVGLTAAADLDARGFTTVVLEQRAFLEAPNVKCNHVAARTMERFRQLGLAEKIRRAGLPADHPHDIAFRTTMTGREFGRIPIPARRDRYTSTHGPDTTWATPEPPHRINQTFLEPILMEHVAALPHVTLLNEVGYESFEQDDDGVTVSYRDAEGAIRQTRGTFMVGADGGRSRVRKQIGAVLSGDPVLQNVQSTCIRSEQLRDALGEPKAWCYYTFNPRRNGHVFSIDGDSTFLVHNYLADDESADTVDRDAAIRTILGVDDSLVYEAVSNEDWTARRLVADRFRDGRVFIAGDAGHLWVPYAGFGMNAGIADGLNLSWALGAYLSGWAGETMLDAYEAERLPITSQVSTFAMSHQRKIRQSDVPPDIEDAGPAGEAAREVLGREAYALNVQQFAAEGLNFGYSYVDSPIIKYDGEVAPGYTMGGYTPSTVPGCRAPHFELPDGRSFYDALGLYYTLLVVEDAATGLSTVEDFLGAATRQGIPFEVVRVQRSAIPDVYEHAFYVIRQDQHVVWRGAEDQLRPEDVLGRLAGFSASLLKR